MTSPLVRSVLGLDPADAAPRLLGATIAVVGTPLVLRVVEVEAYHGLTDEASHAYRRLTIRNAPMFSDPGTLYVYRSYGLHWCVNLTCRPSGEPAAVLLRAAEVVAGAGLARVRRPTLPPSAPDPRLASGPGNLGAVLALSAADSGTTLGHRLALDLAADAPVSVLVGPRVGITRGVATPWRFALPSPAVSSPRRALRADDALTRSLASAWPLPR